MADTKGKRGFAAMSKEKRREIASKGGQASTRSRSASSQQPKRSIHQSM